MRLIRNSHTFAFLQGLIECLWFGPDFGRTHESDHDWNEAYDRGMNAADWLCRRRA